MIEKTIIGDMPVTIANVKKQLNIEDSFYEDDTYLEGLIEVAVDYITGEINADIVETSNVVTIEDPDKILTFHSVPLLQIDSIIDGDENDVTDEYEVEKDWSEFTIETENDYDEITLTFSTGYETLSACLRQSIIIYAASLYDENRNTAIIGTTIAPTKIIPALIRKEQRKYY